MKEEFEESNHGVNIHLPEGYSGEPVEVVIRHGEATTLIDPLKPEVIDINATIDAPLRWLEKRVSESDQIDQKRCHIIVNRDEMSIELTIDESNKEGSTIRGLLKMDPTFGLFGINTGKQWEPNKLGEFFKMNRAFFPDRTENMTLVSTLKNFVAKINSNLDKMINQNGSRSDVFSQEVDSNLPPAFKIKIPVFKGDKNMRELEVEIYSDVQGSSVSLTLVSAEANEFITNTKSTVIDDVLDKIRDIAPGIVIIEQ